MCVLCDHLSLPASNCFYGAVTDAETAGSGDTPYAAEDGTGGDPVLLGSTTVSLDGLFIGTSWTKPTLTFGFGGSVADYPANYSSYGELNSFSTMAEDGRDIFRSAFTMWDGAIGLALSEAPVGSGQDTPDIMIGGTTATTTAWAYGPGTTASAGDIWVNTSSSYNALFRQNDGGFVGSYAYAIALHEIGHSLGLKHPHQGTIEMPYLLDLAYDSLEYTIMSYRSFTGDTSPGAWNVTEGHYPQSPMMLDIRALQMLYGADHEARSADTVYAFAPGSGEMRIDGIGQGVPAANVVFRTLWDGGGTDTIDLSAHTRNLAVDLRPGAGIDLDVDGTAQRARLGNDLDGTPVFAPRHIYMSLLHENDPSSLVENAIGGAGNDVFVGNSADNSFDGGGGYDIVVYEGRYADYAVDLDAGTVFGTATGTDRLSGIERLRFDDLDVDLPGATASPEDAVNDGPPAGFIVDGTPLQVIDHAAYAQGVGSHAISDGGDSLTVSDNGWKAVEIGVNISRTTILSFDFAAPVLGEIHAIGFARGDTYSTKTIFQLAGSQNWGLQTHNGHYSGDGGLQRYDIAVGKSLTGDFDRLVFVADDDAATAGDSVFANVTFDHSFIVDGAPLRVIDHATYDQGVGSHAISDGGLTLTVSDNGWKAVEMNVTITEDTVLSFDFASTNLREIHAIGFARGDDYDPAAIYQLAGSQNWGLQTHNGHYSGGGALQRYDIAVGKSLTGDFDRLVFVADDDAAAAGDSVFANVTFDHSFIVDGAPLRVIDHATYDQGVGSHAVSGDGLTLTVSDNGWKAVEMNVTITEDTVLSFDFASTNLREIHAIGFARGDDYDPAAIYQLAGSQNWGLQTHNGRYSGDGGLQRYDIAVGKSLTGDFDRLVFVADDDAAAAGDSVFANVEIA